MYELLDQHKMFHPTCLDDFKNLQDLLTRFEVRTLKQHINTFLCSSASLWCHRDKCSCFNALISCHRRLSRRSLPTWSQTDSWRLPSTAGWPSGETRKSRRQWPHVQLTNKFKIRETIVCIFVLFYKLFTGWLCLFESFSLFQNCVNINPFLYQYLDK